MVCGHFDELFWCILKCKTMLPLSKFASDFYLAQIFILTYVNEDPWNCHYIKFSFLVLKCTYQNAVTTQVMLVLIFINMYLLFGFRELFVIFVKHLSVIAKSAWQHMLVNVLSEMATALNVNEESGIMVYCILMCLNEIKDKLNLRQCLPACISSNIIGGALKASKSGWWLFTASLFRSGYKVHISAPCVNL